MTPEELATPPTPLEAAELLRATTMPDHQLSQAGVDVLRRLIFDWERVRSEGEELAAALREAIERCGEPVCVKSRETDRRFICGRCGRAEKLLAKLGRETS
jgi:ribosomal protein S27AE